jgi:hypothetical protein
MFDVKRPPDQALFSEWRMAIGGERDTDDLEP